MDDVPLSSDRLRPKRERGSREVQASRNCQNMSISKSPVHLEHDDGRPTSRRGIKDEKMMTPTQDSNSYHRSGVAMSSRPPSAARMMNQTRPGTGMSAPYKRPMSGTASRLASTVLNQQNGIGTGYGLSTVVNVMDRPVTQQGLSGISSNGIKSGGGIGSGGRGPQRQVKDASYFMGILRSKVGELGSEITRIAQETEAGTSQRAALALYDKRVKEMAAELTDLQGQLSDYNLLLDRVNVNGVESMGGGSWEAEAELADLKARNEVESNRVEDLFSLRKKAEDKAKALSSQIEQEQKVADLLITSLGKDEQMLYSQLQTQDLELQETIQVLQTKTSALNSEREALRARIASSQPRQEAVRIKHQIQEALERRDSLITSNPGEFHNEPRQKLTMEEERARLLERVKDDNIETVMANQRAEEAEEQAQRLRQDLAGMLQTEGDVGNKSQLEYQELKLKEKEIEEFLASVDEQCQKEESRIASTEAAVVEALSKLSSYVSVPTALQPSLEEIWAIKESVNVNDSKLEKSAEHSNQLQGRKMAVLEKKIMTEIESLRPKIVTIEGDLNEIKDLESVKLQGRLQLKELEKERKSLETKLKSRKNVEESVSSVTAKCEMLQQELEEDAHWIVLRNLERKLSQVKQGNMALQDYVEGKRYEHDCSVPKARAIDILGKVQDTLKKNLQPSSLNASLIQGKVG